MVLLRGQPPAADEKGAGLMLEADPRVERKMCACGARVLDRGAHLGKRLALKRQGDTVRVASSSEVVYLRFWSARSSMLLSAGPCSITCSKGVFGVSSVNMSSLHNGTEWERETGAEARARPRARLWAAQQQCPAAQRGARHRTCEGPAVPGAR